MQLKSIQMQDEIIENKSFRCSRLETEEHTVKVIFKNSYLNAKKIETSKRMGS